MLGPRPAVAVATLFAVLASAADARDPRDLHGPRALQGERPPAVDSGRAGPRHATVDTVRYWNGIAVDTTGLDHTALTPGEDRSFGHQLGPGRSSRAMAIVHIAMFDALNAIVGGYHGYTRLGRAAADASPDAAVAQAAHDTLVALFPSHAPRLGALLRQDLEGLRVRDARAKRKGIEVGRRAAAAILALRADDHSDYVEPRLGSTWVTSDAPGRWRQDPIGRSPVSLGAYWGHVRPFVIPSAERFRTPPPPALDSLEYAQAYDEVQRLGGDGVVTPTERTLEQTHIGIYWAYDGTPSLCAPPRLYNQIAIEVTKRVTRAIELARLLALVHTAMADAAIAMWESKYYYDYWRPVTGIREADEGTGPTGLGDNNPLTRGDPSFTPLGAPASNLLGPNFTPPFPAYPSGHAGFGSALFEVLRRHYGTDRVAFTFTSDELNGVTLDNDGVVRPLLPRSFASFSEAELENGQSRIYLGIHWQFDITAGIDQGRRVGAYVQRNAFQPARRARARD